MKLNSIFFILICGNFFRVTKKECLTNISLWKCLKDSIVTFDLPELDSTKRYDLFINLGYNNYQYNNLFDCVC
jgi:hypothetical protein